MGIIIPANVIILFSYIIPVAMFDVLENDYDVGYQMILKFDEDKQEEL